MEKRKKMRLGEIIRIYRNNEVSDVFHESQISDLNEEQDELLLTCPIVQSEFIVLPINLEIRIEYMRGDSGKYSFVAKIKEHIRENNVFLLKIQRISSIDKIQIRSYFRLYEQWIFKKFFYFDQECDEEEIKSINISAGGIKFFTNYLHSEDDIIFLELEEEEFAIKLKARVIHSIESTSRNYNYIVNAVFEEVGRFEKEHLIHHIFERQRIIRKNRVLKEKGEDNIDIGYRFGVRNKRRKYKYADLSKKARRV